MWVFAGCVLGRFSDGGHRELRSASFLTPAPCLIVPHLIFAEVQREHTAIGQAKFLGGMFLRAIHRDESI
jgi:hypothetical protein